MLIITRYFLREFLKTFLLCMAAFIALYLLVDLFERMDDMIENRVAVGLIIKYCLCTVPLIIHQVCPLGVLLCTFLTIGTFVRTHEITALKAGGVSLYRVLRVFVLIACGLCLVTLWMQEYVLPLTNATMKEIKNIHIKGRTVARMFQLQHFWYRSNETVYNIDYFDPEKNMLRNITILYFRPEDAFLYKRIDAARAVWNRETWQFSDGTMREFTPAGEMRVSTFAQRPLSIGKTPEDFRMSRTEAQDMGFSEIRDYIGKLKRAGYPVTASVVDMHAKISYSFINIIMAVLGIPFALRIGRSGGMALGIAISIGLGFGYWTFFAFCLSLGKSGAISPFVSAWIANIAFGALGLYMFLRVRQ